MHRLRLHYYQYIYETRKEIKKTIHYSSETTGEKSYQVLLYAQLDMM